jgi:hypothetical protein
MLLTITYWEQDKDPAAIKSPSDWKLTPVFEKILSTFTNRPGAPLP